MAQYQLDAAAAQIRSVFDGLPESLWTVPTGAAGMTPLEIVTHLTDCYVAAQAVCRGEKYEWGSFVMPKVGTEEMIGVLMSERDKASTALLAIGDESAYKNLTQYIVLHDAYHVGQVAALRVARNPEWDPYSMYA